MVTHNISFLDQTDMILVLKDGEVIESGTYHDLIKQDGGNFATLIQENSTRTSDNLEETSKSNNNSVRFT